EVDCLALTLSSSFEPCLTVLALVVYSPHIFLSEVQRLKDYRRSLPVVRKRREAKFRLQLDVSAGYTWVVLIQNEPVVLWQKSLMPWQFARQPNCLPPDRESSLVLEGHQGHEGFLP